MSDKTVKYELNDMLANIRTHIPDFDMASTIMGHVRKALQDKPVDVDADVSDKMIDSGLEALDECYNGNKGECDRFVMRKVLTASLSERCMIGKQKPVDVEKLKAEVRYKFEGKAKFSISQGRWIEYEAKYIISSTGIYEGNSITKISLKLNDEIPERVKELIKK